MKGNRYIALLIKKWTGQASNDDVHTLDSWQQTADINKDFAKESKEIWDLTASYKDGFEPNVEAGLSKLKGRIAAEISAETPVVQMQPRRRFMKIAAAIVLLLGSAFLLRNIMDTDKTWIEIRTADNSQQVELMDGTIVTLNKGSLLSHPHLFSDKRTVKLSGEAFFEVAKDAEHPFIIETEHSKTTVLGTSFNVRAYDDESITEVQVKTGKVRFSPKGIDTEAILEANNKAIYNAETLAFESVQDRSLNGMAWHSKQFSFRKTPVSEVINDMERYFHVDIKINKPSIGKCTFTSVTNNPNLDEMLQTLVETFDLQLKQPNATTYELVGGQCK